VSGTGPIIQSSTITPGHVAAWVAPGVVQDGGPPGAGNATEIGLTKASGDAIAVTTAIPPAAYGYFGFGFDPVTGNAQISVNSYGGWPLIGLQYEINGVTYGFPGAGTGDVVGPTTSTIGDLPAFNSSNGILLSDSGIAASNVVQNTSTVTTAGDIPVFSGSGGRVIADAGFSAASLPASLPNIAALRAVTTAFAQTQCYLLGYYAGDDGGEGIFWYNSADVSSADNGGTIIVDASSRRWYRQSPGPYTFRQFGAYGNASNATTTTAAIQACFNAALAANVGVYDAGGTYAISSAITLTPVVGMKFQGGGQQITVFSPTVATIDIFRVTTTTFSPVEMSDFSVNYGITASAGTMLNFVGGCGGLNLHDISTYNGWNVLLLGGGSGSQSFMIRNINCFDFLNNGIIIQIGTGGLGFFKNIQMNCSSSNNGIGLGCTSGQAMTFDTIQVQGCQTPIIFNASVGSVITDITCVSVYGDNAARGNTGNVAWTIGSGSGATRRISLVNCWGGSSGASGFELISVDMISMVNCTAIANATDGITLQNNCTNITIDACQCIFNSQSSSGTYNGITVNAVCGNVSITNCRCGTSADFPSPVQGYGIEVGSGATNDLIISLNRLNGNVSGGLLNGASGGSTYVANNLLT
jgi:hypothetical protein